MLQRERTVISRREPPRTNGKSDFPRSVRPVPAADLVLRLLAERCRDRTAPRARTQRKEGSIRALVWSRCSRVLSSSQGMNIERSNPGWSELFRPSPPSSVLVTISLSLAVSRSLYSSNHDSPPLRNRYPLHNATAESRSRVNTHPLTPLALSHSITITLSLSLSLCDAAI